MWSAPGQANASQPTEQGFGIGDVIGLSVMGILALTLSIPSGGWIIAILLVAAAIGVYLDARRCGVRKQPGVHTLTNNSPIGWAVGTFLLAIVVMPLYLSARNRVRTRDAGRGFLVLACAASGLVLLNFCVAVGAFAYFSLTSGGARRTSARSQEDSPALDGLERGLAFRDAEPFLAIVENAERDPQAAAVSEMEQEGTPVSETLGIILMDPALNPLDLRWGNEETRLGWKIDSSAPSIVGAETGTASFQGRPLPAASVWINVHYLNRQAGLRQDLCLVQTAINDAEFKMWRSPKTTRCDDPTLDSALDAWRKKADFHLQHAWPHREHKAQAAPPNAAAARPAILPGTVAPDTPGVGGAAVAGPTQDAASNLGGAASSALSPYTVESCGAISAATTNLEWYVGPDRDTTWSDAAGWVKTLAACGGGWRMPTVTELAALYDPSQSAGTGYVRNGEHFPAKIGASFSRIGGGSWVWSAQTPDPSHAVAQNLFTNTSVTISRAAVQADGTPFATRAFAVRSQLAATTATVELAPEDGDFVDTRGGQGWGDRCWKHLKSGQLPWAKAECDKALEMNPASPQPRASLLYNEGIIEQRLGHNDAARTYYLQSLALRPHADVQAALDSLDNAQP